MSERLGLIAGGGRLPLEVAAAAGRREVFAVGFPGITDPDLEAVVEGVAWQPLGAIDAALGSLAAARVREVVLAGKIDKSDLVRSPEQLALDARGRALLASLADRHDPTVHAAVAELLEAEGFSVLPQAACVPHLVAAPGVQGKVEPGAAACRDLAFGWPLAGALAASGVGQSIVVKGGAVVAVEALEGTDAMIARAVALAGGGVTVVKRAGPAHDPRFDQPVIGPRTLARLEAAGGGVLAFEAGTTLVLDRAELVARADRAGVAVVAVGPEGPAAAQDAPAASEVAS